MDSCRIWNNNSLIPNCSLQIHFEKSLAKIRKEVFFQKNKQYKNTLAERL